MVGYNCTCSSGFQGRHCDEMIIQSTTELTTKPTANITTTISERSYTTTSQNTTTSESVTTEAKTKSAASPSTTMPERSEATTSQETTISTCSSPPVDCEFGGSLYNFSTSEMNHASAVSACSEYGSHLVFIESQEEEDFIMEHGQCNDWNTYWIGLTGLSLSEARWLDGSSLTYSNFDQYSFNDNVNCFRIKCTGQYSRWRHWRDRDCSTQYRFICEKEMRK
eukprot:XP_011678742.1 PREDICTED: CD209 antigen-like protein D [Strongylocentrotus purpuratus]